MIDKLVSNRLGGCDFFNKPHIYRFTKLLELKEKEKKKNKQEMLDFGIGEPGEMASSEVVDTMYQEAKKFENRIYADNGIEEFKDVIKQHMNKEYGVKIDSNDQILPIMGAKSALAYLPYCFINEGDIVVSCTPGYVVLENAAKWLGAKIINLPITKDNDFYPSLDSISEEIWLKTKIFYINYPNNPTGQIPNRKFYKKLITLALKYNFVIVNDAAYLPLTFNKKHKISFLSIKDADKVGVEIHTLSKGYNMTGWRIGYAVGNAKIIKLLATVKDNCDSGQFIPIQKGAITALNSGINKQMATIYHRRLKYLFMTLKSLNLDVLMPKAGFYLYVKVPEYVNLRKINSASEFAIFLLEQEQIFVIPYDNAGKYVRFSVTFVAKNKQEEYKIIDELKQRLLKYLF